jgi:hypothetical protein
MLALQIEATRSIYLSGDAEAMTAEAAAAEVIRSIQSYGSLPGEPVGKESGHLVCPRSIRRDAFQTQIYAGFASPRTARSLCAIRWSRTPTYFSIPRTQTVALATDQATTAASRGMICSPTSCGRVRIIAHRGGGSRKEISRQDADVEIIRRRHPLIIRPATHHRHSSTYPDGSPPDYVLPTALGVRLRP